MKTKISWLLFVLLSSLLLTFCSTVDHAPTTTEASVLSSTSFTIGRGARVSSPAPPLHQQQPSHRDPLVEAAAACSAFDGSWRCAGASITKQKVLASGSQPIVPTSWTVTDWFWDFANSTGCASDKNSGTSATCVGGCAGSVCTSGIGPLLTYQEANVHRWGCQGNPSLCPRWRQNVTRHFLSSQSGNADPIAQRYSLENGAMLTNTCTLTQIATGTIGAGNVTAKNRSTPQLLAVNFSGFTGVGSIAAGQYAVNATHPSHAYVYSSAGGSTWNMTQPLAPTTFPATPNTLPPEVDTWAPGDTITIFNPVAVNLVDDEPTIVDYNPANFANFAYWGACTWLDPTGAGDDNVYIGPHVQVYDVHTQRAPFYVGTPSLDEQMIFANVYNEGGLFGGPSAGSFWVMAGGALGAQGAVTGIFSPAASVVYDEDVIYNPVEGVIIGGDLGLVFLATGVTLIQGGGNVDIATDNSVKPALWGPGSVAIKGNGHMGVNLAFGGGFTSVLLLKGTISINGFLGNEGAQRVLCNTTAAPATLVEPSVALSGATLDAACAAGTGFGTQAFVLGGGSISEGLN